MGELQTEFTKPVIQIQDSDEDAAAGNDEVTVSVWQTLLVPDAEPSKFGGIKKQARQRQSDVQQRLEKTFALEHRVTEAIRGRRTFSDVRRIVAHSNIVTSVAGEEAGGLKVSYREQGNLEMYTNANLKKT